MPYVFTRSEQRRRWRAHLALAAIVAIAVAAVVATLSAADRSEDAFHRLRSVTRASDVTVFGAADADEMDATTATLESSSAVDAASGEVEVFVRPAGAEDLFPDFNLYPRAPTRTEGGSRVNVPVVVEGRAVNPRRADEVALSEALAAELDVSVGDKLVLESMTDAWVDSAFNGGDPGPPDGPRIETTVVGVVRTPADFGRWRGVMHLSPAFVARYDGQMRMYGWVEARLAAGAADGAVRGSALRLLTGLPDDREVGPSNFADDAATADGLGTIATALRLIAAVAGMAGAVVVAFVLARLTRLTLSDRPTLVALGCTSRQLVGAALAVLTPWFVLGVGVGCALGVVLAPSAIVGLAADVDPDPNAILINGPVVLGAAMVALIAGVTAIAVVAHHARLRERRRARLPVRVLRIDRPIPLVLGARHAVAGESELGGRTSRAAILTMTVGLAGAVAALTVSASIGRLQTDPLLTGQGTGSVVDSGESTEAFDTALPLLRRNREIAQLAGLHTSFDVSSAGHDLTVLSYDPIRGSMRMSVVQGREPSAQGEVGLGPETLDSLGKQVGDRIRLRGSEGSATYRIVGAVLFPEGDFSYDEGVAMTAESAGPILGNVHDTGAIHQVLFQWADGVDPAVANRVLRRAGISVFTNADALTPARVTNLGEVKALPRYLAGLLGVLALATLAHALALSTRRRTREGATLRALGLTPRAGSEVVGAQATTIVAIAVVCGVPIGVLLGTRVWTLLAERANVVVRTVAPGGSIAAFVFAIVVASGLITALPAWRAYRLRVAPVLRSE